MPAMEVSTSFFLAAGTSASASFVPGAVLVAGCPVPSETDAVPARVEPAV